MGTREPSGTNGENPPLNATREVIRAPWPFKSLSRFPPRLILECHALPRQCHGNPGKELLGQA
jgi:hypothetical protein